MRSRVSYHLLSALIIVGMMALLFALTLYTGEVGALLLGYWLGVICMFLLLCARSKT